MLLERLFGKLGGRLSKTDISEACRMTQGERNNDRKEALYQMIDNPDIKIGYNALWIFTHFALSDNEWLYDKRNDLIDKLLTCRHTGKTRLLLTLLERQPIGIDDIRTDYLNFCLSNINSTEPYAIRALCMKQAYSQCRFYPELLEEFTDVLGLMDCSQLSPGIATARRNILRQMARLDGHA